MEEKDIIILSRALNASEFGWYWKYMLNVTVNVFLSNFPSLLFSILLFYMIMVCQL